MVLKQDQQRVKALLKETITLLCKNGLHYKSEFCIEALIGITLDQDDVFLVSIKETIRDGLQAAKSSIQSTEVDTHAASLRGSKDKERMTSHNSVDLFPHKAHQSQHHSKPVDIDTDSVKTEIDQSNVYENDHNFTHSDDVKTEPMAGDAYNDKSVNVSEKRTFDEDDAEIERTENQAISPDLAENFKKRQKITELGEDNQCVSDDSDVVFIKDEPLSDTELEQVTLGLAEAEHSQAMQEFPYYPQTSHSGIPSGRTEPLPGCSNWNDPAEGSIPMSGLSSHTSDQAQTGPMGAFSGNNTQMSPAWRANQSSSDGYVVVECIIPGVSTSTEEPEKEKYYQCVKCSYKSKWLNNTRRHLSLHTGAVTRCSECGTTYHSQSALRQHKVLKHNLVRQDACRCTICGESFSNTGLLDQHSITKHSIEQESITYQCGECPRIFNVASALNGHLRVHSNDGKQDRPYFACN